MHTIVNLTKQVVMLRLNSGTELNIGPEQKLERVLPSEIRDNAVITKLKRLQQIAVTDDVRPAPAAPDPPDSDPRSNGPQNPKERSEKKSR